MTHPCVKCGKELKYVTFDCSLQYDVHPDCKIEVPVCDNPSCPFRSLLQAGLEPIIWHCGKCDQKADAEVKFFKHSRHCRKKFSDD